MSRKQEALKALSANGVLYHFMPRSQRQLIAEMLNGEESQFFEDKVMEFVDRITGMHATYQQDGMGEEAIVHLHYFGGPVDAWVTEKDVGDGSGNLRQLQAFGYVNLDGSGFDGAEAGYVSICELIEYGIELDLYWEPKPIKDLRRPVNQPK